MPQMVQNIKCNICMPSYQLAILTAMAPLHTLSVAATASIIVIIIVIMTAAGTSVIAILLYRVRRRHAKTWSLTVQPNALDYGKKCDAVLRHLP